MDRLPNSAEILLALRALCARVDDLREGQAALRGAVDSLQRNRAGLDAGREKAIAQARRRGLDTRVLVLNLAAAELAAGRPCRGLAGRIARKLPGVVSESQTRRILRTLSSVADSSLHDGPEQLRMK